MGILTRSLAFAVFVLPAIGCILIAPDSFTSVDHCPIPGTSACAVCMKASCQAPYDACCTSSDCRNNSLTDTTAETFIDAVDQCAKGDNCSVALAGAQTSAQGTSLESCMTTNCRSQCKATDEVVPIANAPTCEYACTSGGTGKGVFCKCTLASLKSGPACETENLHDPSGQGNATGRCCVDQLGADVSCTCDLVSSVCGNDTTQVDSCTELDMEPYAIRTETCVH